MTDDAPSSDRLPADAIVIDCHRALPPFIRVAEIVGVHQRAYAPIGLRGWSGAEIESCMANPVSRLVIATSRNGEVRGFMIANIVEDEGEILALAVDPAYQRQNIASNLINNFVNIEKDKKINRLVLEVLATNDGAVSFYEILKFQQIALRRNYYLIDGIRVDARLMERR